MPVEAGQVIAERYRLVRPIGKGAQASVWIAEHLALGSQVAVKVMDPELVEQGDAKDRFKREATAAAQLRSAHVVQILDHGIDGNQPYMVMELLDGEDLFQRLERRNRLTMAEASLIVTQIARALARAHAAGIVHRDLKPENVYLVPNEDDEIAKVLDFGVAKFLETGASQRRTSAGTLLGTPHYMSPEQVRGVGEIDHRSDLWSLGVIAFQLTTGDLPFESEGVGDLLIKITMDRIPVPSARRPDLPRAFDAWFARACHREVDKRFQTARELAEALARVAGLVPPPAESLRGAAMTQAKALSEAPAFEVDFEDVEVPPAAKLPSFQGAPAGARHGAAPAAPPQRPPPPGSAVQRTASPARPTDDVDEDWPDAPIESVAPPPASAGPARPPPRPRQLSASSAPLGAAGTAPSGTTAAPPGDVAGAAPAVRAPADRAPADRALAEGAPAEGASSGTAPRATHAPDASSGAAVGDAAPARAPAPPPPPRPLESRPFDTRPAAPAAVDTSAPVDASTADGPRSKSPLSSTISGASGDVLPPPQLDGSRKRRTVLFVAIAAMIGAGALALAVVRSHGVGDARIAPASTGESPPERPAPAVVEPPPEPTPSASASAVATAVDPGRSKRPVRNTASGSPRPPAATGGARKLPPRKPPPDDGEVVIEVPLPEREVPIPPSP